MNPHEIQLRINIQEFEKTIAKLETDTKIKTNTINTLKKKKSWRLKQLFLKIITFGCYDLNKKINKKIANNTSSINYFREKIEESKKILIKNNHHIQSSFLKENCSTTDKKITTTKPNNIPDLAKSI